MKFRIKLEATKYVVQRSTDSGRTFETISSPYATEAEARLRLEIHFVQAAGRLPQPGEVTVV